MTGKVKETQKKKTVILMESYAWSLNSGRVKHIEDWNYRYENPNSQDVG